MKASHKNDYSFADLKPADDRKDLHIAERDCAERDLHQLPAAHRAARIAFSHDKQEYRPRDRCRRRRQANRRSHACEAVTRPRSLRTGGKAKTDERSVVPRESARPTLGAKGLRDVTH